MTTATPTTTPTTILLSANGVTKYYGDGPKRILVLQDINLNIREGEIVAILGPSGSGKSTLLRILAGLSNPSEGTVSFRGQVQSGPNPNIAIVFQTFALFPWLSVYQNVEVGLLNSDVPETQRRRRILEAIDVIGLDGFEDAFPKELSGGMRQRVGFARALVVQPQILFMDEPFSALDVLTAENLKRELLSLWRSHKIPTQSIVMVTHNIEEAVFMGDRLIVMGHNPGVVRVNMAGLPIAERGREHPEHVRLVDYLYNVMTNPAGTAPPPFHPEGEPLPVPSKSAPSSAYQMLPHVPVGRITGLVERLHHQGDRADLYVLGRELQMEVDDLLPLVQAIDLLSLGDIEEGDVVLTPTGIRFAEAGVLEEKDVFREQARANVQLIQTILKLIDSSPNKRVRWETVLEKLTDCFSEEEAVRQLETAIDWGRYAELFSYDDSEGVFTRDVDDDTRPATR